LWSCDYLVISQPRKLLARKGSKKELGKKVRREIVEGVVNQRVRGPAERGRTKPEIVCIGEKL
jgi:hypothetical protein